MLIFLMIVVVIIIGAGLLKLVENNFSDIANFAGIVGIFLITAGFTMLIFAAIMVPIQRMDTFSEIAELEALQETANQSRTEMNTLEGVAFRKEISDGNRWLKSNQYYNNTLFDIWIPDQIMSVKPVK